MYQELQIYSLTYKYDANMFMVLFPLTAPDGQILGHVTQTPP